MTYGMKATGEPERLRPKQVLRFLGAARVQRLFWAGILSWRFPFIVADTLSWQPISFVIPASA